MANKKLSAVVTIGGAIASSLKSAFGQTQAGVLKIGQALKDAEKKQRELTHTITYGSARATEAAQKELAVINKQVDALKRKHTEAKLGAARSRMAGAGIALGATAAVAATGLIPIKQAADFETAMLGVAKQVDGARDSSGKLTSVYYDMAKQVQILGREIPIPTNELAEMVAAGARMGIAKDELIDFTKTASMMATAFDLPAAELADQMGKISTLFKIPIPKIGELADAINYLDDNAISKGSDIIEFLQRTGGVAGSVKTTGKEMAALGSTLLTLGERSETASTATNAFFQKLAAADKGTKKFKQAFADLGLSTAEIQKGMQVDAQGTILKVLEAVNKLPVDKRTGALVEMIGLEHSDTIAKLAVNIGEYRKQIDLVNNQKAKGSMSREFQAQLATTNAQWAITKNRVLEIGVNIGSVLLPAVNSLLGGFGAATSAVADFVSEHKVLVGNVTTVAVTLGALFAATKLVSFGIGLATFAFTALSRVMTMNPIGLAVTALAVAAALVYKNWEPIKEFFVGLWNGVVDGAKTAFQWVMDKLAVIGEYWGKFKSLFGGGSTASSPSMSATPTLPALPAMATASGGTQNNTQNISFAINQQPGQDNKSLTDEIMRKIKEQDAVKNRGVMYDHALGY